MDGAALSAPVGAPSLPGIAPGSVAAWSMALRPRSLVVAVSPVVAAVALIWARGAAIDPWLVLLVLAVAVMMQVITNLQNDVGYTTRGAEQRGTRIGLPRATGMGLLTPAQVRVAIGLAILVTLVLGLPFVQMRGVPALLLGAASILAALAYMGGPRPIAYTPLGEPTVFMFFGLVAVVGTDFALTGTFDDPALWIAGVALGAIATAAIMVNNSRDWEHDREVGRRTLAVVAGRRAMDSVFAALVLGPLVLMLPLAWILGSPWLLLPALLLAPACIRLVRDFGECPPGLPYNAILFRTFLMELKFAALLAIGAVMARLF
jgi:1,4-dihydroxy-2-naphthoate octaprenyltransferase